MKYRWYRNKCSNSLMLYCGIALFSGLALDKAQAGDDPTGIQTTDVSNIKTAGNTATQLEQQIENALGLGKDTIKELTSGIDDALKTVQDVQDSIAAFKKLDPSSKSFIKDLRGDLTKAYNIPKDGISAAAEVEKMFNGGSSGSSGSSGSASLTSDKANRDTNDSMKKIQSIEIVKKQNDDLNNKIEVQDEELASLGNDSLAATLQFMATQNSILQHQKAADIRLQQIESDIQEEKRLRELELENQRAEDNLNALKGAQTLINTEATK